MSVYRTIGPLVIIIIIHLSLLAYHIPCFCLAYRKPLEFLLAYQMLFIRFSVKSVFSEKCFSGCFIFSRPISNSNTFKPLLEKTTIWIPTRSDTDRPVQSQKQARFLKLWNAVIAKLVCAFCFSICKLLALAAHSIFDLH